MHKLILLFFLIFAVLLLSRIKVTGSRRRSLLSTSLIYLLVSFIVLHIFMLRWGFRGEHERFGFPQMMNYTAHRPFVYRTLMPLIVNSTSKLFSDEFLNSRKKWLTEYSPVAGYEPGVRDWDVRLSLKYHITYLYLFLSLVLLLFAMRYLIRLVYKPPPVFCDLYPALALLFLPLTFLEGGYFYDFPELLLMGICLIFLIRKKWLFYYLGFFLAVLNKESNVLLVLFFMAFYGRSFPRKDYLKHIATHILIGALIIIPLRMIFVSWPGYAAALPNALDENLGILLTPKTYFLFFDAYYLGLPVFPKGLNILSILSVIFLVFYRWKEKPSNIKRLFIFTFLALLPVYIYSGYVPEIRALSLAFPALFLLAFHTLYTLISGNKKVKGSQR